MVKELLRRNADWAARRDSADPGYFARMAEVQTPEFFWIGCSDSRVPENVVAGLDPGEMFVHRNVANVVHSDDLNFLSTLEFAVEALGIRKVIVCGHYGCGGVERAAGDLPASLSEHWLAPIRRLARAHQIELDALSEGAARADRLAELNVVDGVARVADTPILRRAWKRGEPVVVHGLIYGLRDGRLRELGCSVGPQAASAAE